MKKMLDSNIFSFSYNVFKRKAYYGLGGFSAYADSRDQDQTAKNMDSLYLKLLFIYVCRNVCSLSFSDVFSNDLILAKFTGVTLPWPLSGCLQDFISGKKFGFHDIKSEKKVKDLLVCPHKA